MRKIDILSVIKYLGRKIWIPLLCAAFGAVGMMMLAKEPVPVWNSSVTYSVHVSEQKGEEGYLLERTLADVLSTLLSTDDELKEIAEEEKEYGSILNFYKRLIAFYKSEEYNEILTYGDFRPMYEKEDHIFAYSRSYGCQKLVLICNFSSKEKDIELSEDYENVVFVNYEQTTVIGNTLKMKPYECVIYEM